MRLKPLIHLSGEGGFYASATERATFEAVAKAQLALIEMVFAPA